MVEGLLVAGAALLFPVGLLVLVMLLDRYESAYVRPEERAATLVALISSSREPDEVEQAAVELFAPLVPGEERVGARR